MICFYHNDNDGHASGAVVRKYYEDCCRGKYDVANRRQYLPLKMFEINYGMPIPWKEITRNERVVIVDFSFEPDDVERLLSLTEDVVWIDHHETALVELEEFDLWGLRRIGTAACELAWEFFFKDEPTPPAIQLVGDYDVWKFDYGDKTICFKYGMDIYNFDPGTKEGWDRWIWLFSNNEYTTDYYIQQGLPIKKYTEAHNEKYLNSLGFYADFEGYNAICCNKALTNSWLFDTIDLSTFDLQLFFSFDGKGYRYSLYTPHEHVHCGKIAERFGGGGHQGAAGFAHKQFLPKFTSKIRKV